MYETYPQAYTNSGITLINKLAKQQEQDDELPF